MRKKREKDYGNGISEIGKQISAIPLTKMWKKKKKEKKKRKERKQQWDC